MVKLSQVKCGGFTLGWMTMVSHDTQKRASRKFQASTYTSNLLALLLGLRLLEIIGKPAILSSVDGLTQLLFSSMAIHGFANHFVMRNYGGSRI
jgi:acetylornithine/succinyldiaminopimelate/putrescine aminotransferase